MPKLYNVSAQYLRPVRTTHRTQGEREDAHDIADHTLHDGPSVPPGEGFDFSDEEAASIGTEWSLEDPRAGLEAERAFKAKRDSKSEASPAPENNEPGDPKES